jgi:hypothetical protein
MKVQVLYYNTDTDDEEIKVMSFHALPRKGETIVFQNDSWRVSEVCHFCSETGVVKLPMIYLEDSITGMPVFSHQSCKGKVE